MLLHSVNVVPKMSYLYKLCGMLVLALALLVSNSQVRAQDASAGGAPAAAAGGGGGDVEKGKTLFNNNCAQCHSVTSEKVVGPGLKGIEERAPSRDWLHKWIRNSSAVIASGDAYANQVFNANGKVQMSSFPSLSDQDIDGILDYIKQGDKPAATTQAGIASTGGGDSGNA